MLREGMFIADRYEILEKIGSGGMSDVYKAKDHKLNRFVAIKVLKSEYSQDKTFVSKFRAEAQSAAGLMHSNIVNVYDVGEEAGIYYIVMELVEGITLKKYIEKKGRLGVREAVSIAIQVAQGIEAAHRHHIIHRDIKPQNIIISKEGKVKVTDFGIARAATSNTINSSVMGSVHYISPEQARGGYSDEKSDIYSFGITLFEMLTGHVPFDGDTTVAVALQHIQDDMVSPRKYLPDMPVSVEKIVLKCTQKKTDRRYQNATDLIADLKRSLITPNEDFVVIGAAIPAGAPTQMIGADDLAEISQKAAQKPVRKADGVDVINPVRDEDEDVTVAAKKVSDYIEPIDEDDDEDTDLYEDDGDDGDTDASKKIDKIITILGIAVAVVIFIITLIIIFKMTGFFKGSTSKKTTEEVTTAEDGTIEVPNLVGRTYDEAKEKLNAAGLGINKTEEYSSLYPEGQIFHQSVDAGDRVAPNTTIIVTVSKGPESFAMPDVKGKPQSEANSTLTNKNLSVTFEYTETDDASLIGTVADTNPKAGTTVNSGDTVVITLYKGKTQTLNEVPKITGKTEADARKAIEAAGFTVGAVTHAYDASTPKGEVISQSGATAGEQAAAGTTINFVVSDGPEPTKPAETTTPEAPTTEAPTTTEASPAETAAPEAGTTEAE